MIYVLQKLKIYINGDIKSDLLDGDKAGMEAILDKFHTYIYQEQTQEQEDASESE